MPTELQTKLRSACAALIEETSMHDVIHALVAVCNLRTDLYVHSHDETRAADWRVICLKLTQAEHAAYVMKV